MRCLICASNLGNQAEADTVSRTIFCKLLSPKLSSEHEALFVQTVFCSHCKELLGLIDALFDDGDRSDIDLLLQTFLDGYLAQMKREDNSNEKNCHFQPLRHDILKQLGMVVELKDEENAAEQFRYNVISFDCNDGKTKFSDSVDMADESSFTQIEVDEILSDTTVQLNVNNNSFPLSSSCTVVLENINVDSTKAQLMLSQEPIETNSSSVANKNSSSRRSKRKPLKPTKGLAALGSINFPKDKANSKDREIISEPLQQREQEFKKRQRKRSSENSKVNSNNAPSQAYPPSQRVKSDSKSSPRQSLDRASIVNASQSVEKQGKTLCQTNSSEKSSSPPLQKSGRSDNVLSKSVSVAKDKRQRGLAPLPPEKSNENEENSILVCSYPGCKRKYTATFALEAHQKRVHEGEKNVFPCTFCTKRFPTKRRLDNHVDRHKVVEEEYPCTQCPLVFTTRAKMEFHMHQHTNDWAVKCDVCSKGFQSTARLEHHKKIHDSTKPFQCNLCPKAFRTVQYLNIHQKNHPPPSTELNRFPCDQCDASFSHLSTFREHQRIHTGELPYSCDICGEKFAFTSRLKRHHSIRHSTQKTYQCRYCHQLFKQPGNLKCHEVRHDTSNKKFKCPHSGCSLTFFDENKLKYHVTVHTGEKPFVCEEASCGKSFRLKAALKVHMTTVHAKVKNHVCHVCDKRFSQRQYLNYHLTTHPELEKPRFTCTESGCGKTFAEPSSLKEHKRKHTGDYRLQCDQCTAKFTFKSRLLKHMATHTRLKKFQCTQCEKYFAIEAYLKRHMRSVHNRNRKRKADYVEQEEEEEEQEEEEEEQEEEEEEQEDEEEEREDEEEQEEADDDGEMDFGSEEQQYVVKQDEHATEMEIEHEIEIEAVAESNIKVKMDL